MESASRSAESRRRQSGAAEAPAPDLQKTLEDMRKSLGLQAAAPGDAARPEFKPGDRVHVHGFEAPGVIAELYERDALVTVGTVKILVARAELAADVRGNLGRNVVPERSSGNVTSDLSLVPGEVDVRGMRVDEAMPIVDKALDSASLAGAAQIRIIHGKGTGQLGRGIREFLRGHPQVAGLATPADREGGTGVTVVTLT